MRYRRFPLTTTTSPVPARPAPEPPSTFFGALSVLGPAPSRPASFSVSSRRAPSRPPEAALPSPRPTRTEHRSPGFLGATPASPAPPGVPLLPGSSLPVPREFFPLTKAHLLVVKCLHHLRQLSGDLPPTLRRTRDKLSTLLCPPALSSDFAEVSRRLADSWATSSVDALRTHYRSVLNSTLRTLASTPLPPPVLTSSLALVSLWARRQLGRRLSDFTLDTALSTIQEHQQLLNFSSSSRPPAPSTPVASVAPAPPSDLSTPTTEHRSPSQEPVPAVVEASTSARRSRPPQPGPSAPSASSVVSLDGASSLVLGDDNVRTFNQPSCRVCTPLSGRLSSLRHFADRQLPPSSSIIKVFVCLSTLDRRNRFSTLSTTAKSLLSRCHCLFPRATLFVLLPGVHPDCSSSEQATLLQFASFLRNKHPNNCVTLASPSPFLCEGDTWSDSTRDQVFSILLRHLN